ncbi:hypothetical protein DFH09DRAFT_1307894 [Mycena vulgaris]|nr:hypothetical protein DFH09DRAFT_1307894 [Mycena vulgaris]
MGQLEGVKLGEAFASADVMRCISTRSVLFRLAFPTLCCSAYVDGASIPFPPLTRCSIRYPIPSLPFHRPIFLSPFSSLPASFCYMDGGGSSSTPSVPFRSFLPLTSRVLALIPRLSFLLRFNTTSSASPQYRNPSLPSSPSITETFGQVTLQGFPVAGLHVEGTANLVAHGETGLLLDPLGCLPPPPSSSSPASSSFSNALSSPSGPATPANASPDANASSEPWSPLTPIPPNTSVACYATGAALMQPTHPAFPVICARYAALLEALIGERYSEGEGAGAGAGEFEAARERWGKRRALACDSRDAGDSGLVCGLDSDSGHAGDAGTRERGATTARVGKIGRREMGWRAAEAAAVYSWAGSGEQVVRAYGEACAAGTAGPAPPRSADSASTYGVEEAEADEEDGCAVAARLARAERVGHAGDGGREGKGEWAGQGLVDAYVVMHALVAATLSHAAYMVPTGRDLFG